MPPLRFACLFIVLVALAGAIASCGDDGGPAAPPASTPTQDGVVTIGLGSLTIRAELALTPEQRTQGLSGRESLPRDAGMLFVHPTEEVPSIVMREMRFPLDLIWISADHRVIDVTENVPAPEPGEALRIYEPQAPVLYVLEVNAGVAQEAGTSIGDTITFE